MRSVRALGIAALIALAAVASGAQHAQPTEHPEPAPLPADWSAPPPADGAISPGREPPVSAPHEGVFQVAWEEYSTFVVIGPGAGLERPAWILTYQDESGSLVVAYRAVAYRDRHGVIHADARNAMIAGPQANNWMPDSFAIFAPGTVSTLDDQQSAQSGVVTKLVKPDQAEYRMLLLLAEALVADGI